MKEASNPKGYPPWLGSRLFSLLTVKPSIRIDDARSLLLRGLWLDRRTQHVRLLSGLLIDRNPEGEEEGAIALTHEWHRNSLPRGSVVFSKNPCGVVRHTLQDGRLVRMELTPDGHAASSLYTATREAGELNNLRDAIFDPTHAGSGAHRASREVLATHTFITPDIATKIGELGLLSSSAAARR